MTTSEQLIGSREAASILQMERSVFTRRTNATPPLLPIAFRGAGSTGEKFFNRADVEALAAAQGALADGAA